MFSVYVLRSEKNKKRYVGYTSKDPLVRLREHNSGCNKYTKENGPFKLMGTELFETKTDAIKREHFLKSGQGRLFLNKVLSGDEKN